MKRSKEDIAWAKLIKGRADYVCERCKKWHGPKSQGLHAAHIFSRRFKTTRHDEENGLALCFGCHMLFHSRPLEAHEFFKEYLGDEKYEALKKRARALKR